jgi:small subunit ribosomal protein S20
MATAKAPVKKSSSAIKRALQGEKRHARNTSVLSRLKTEEKKLRAALATGADEVTALYRNFTSALDKAAKQGIIHKNAASRKKSRLNSRLSSDKEKSVAVAKPKKTAVKKAAPKAKAKLKPRKK